MGSRPENRIADRFSAAAIGLLCGLAMAFLWSFIALRGVGACYPRHPSVADHIICHAVRGVYWILLGGPPLVGLLFGSDTLLKVLSKLWGTDRSET